MLDILGYFWMWVRDRWVLVCTEDRCRLVVVAMHSLAVELMRVTDKDLDRQSADTGSREQVHPRNWQCSMLILPETCFWQDGR